ncbi:MAG: TIGR01777 family oxidoreductase [Acidimicrobiales bacterium]
MRVLLTGATGFIGKSVAKALGERGDVVVAVTRRPPVTGEVGLDLTRGRLDTTRLPGGTLEGIDASVHLAGAPIFGRWTAARREEIRSSRIAVGDLVARTIAVLERRPSVHVTGSAVGIYGERGDEVLDESSETGSGFLPEVCRSWEEAAAPAAAAGIRTVAIRTGIVLGEGGALGAQLPIFKLGLGGRLGDGQQWTSWISLDDEVAAILLAIDDQALEGPVNAVSPNPVRNIDFTRSLAAALHRPAALSVPASALELLFGRGPAREMLLVSERVAPKCLVEAGFGFRHESLESALGTVTR